MFETHQPNANMALQRFEDSYAWKKAMEMAVEVTDAVDDCKRFAFVDQIYRAALSVPTNLAEGFGRPAKPDRMRFIAIAKGSCNETRSLLYFGKRKGLLSQAVFERLHGLVEETGKLIHAQMRSPFV
jgi:four helix bundle protein